MSTQGKVGISSGGALASNLSRLGALLQPYATSGLPHLIDGASTPSEGGATFETRSPVDDSLIANVARGTAADVDRAAHAAARAFGPWRDLSAGRRRAILLAVADAIEERADEIALLECMDTGQALRFMSKAALRGAENFRFFADRAPGARDGLSLPTRDAPELHAAPADRPGRRHHAVEHAVHAVDLEDRAGAGGRLHGRAQAGGVVAGHGRRCWRRSALKQAGLPRRRAQHRARHRRGGRQGADRASRHQGDRLRRRELDRLARSWRRARRR